MARGTCPSASAREEVDVDLTHATTAELDVARAEPVVGPRLVAAPQARDQRGGDNTRRSLGEHSSLGYSDRRDVAEGVYARKPRLERLRVHGHVAVYRHPACDDHVGGAVLRDAEEEVVLLLTIVVEHGDAPFRVECADPPVRHELDATLLEGGNKRARGIR